MPVSNVPLRIAVTVMNFGPGPTPCPFFGKCDGIVVMDSVTGAREFHDNPARTSRSLCGVILGSGADGLVCGFIAEPEILRLRAAGVDNVQVSGLGLEEIAVFILKGAADA